MRSALAILLLAIPAAARASEWTRVDTALELGFAAAVVVDWRQTEWALANGHEEMNPLLGHRPERSQLRAMALAGVLGHALVSAALPQPYRRWWQGVTLVGEVAAVGHNATVGVRLSF